MDGMRGQYSSVSIPSSWCLLCHVYTVKSMQEAGSRDSSKEDSGELYMNLIQDPRVLLVTDKMGNVSAAAVHNDCHNTVMCFHFCESLYCGTHLWHGLHLEEDDLKAYSQYSMY
jgi:hypothetical protein